MYPSIDHGCTFYPYKEGGGVVFYEELVEVYGLVNDGVCRRWRSCADWRGEEWEILSYP